MTYENDFIARYLASRVIQIRADDKTGITYEKAITSTKTTKDAIDWWIAELS
jgi:hypothetical protein